MRGGGKTSTVQVLRWSGLPGWLKMRCFLTLFRLPARLSKEAAFSVFFEKFAQNANQASRQNPAADAVAKADF